MKSTAHARSHGRACRMVAPIRLQLELLESRWLPGETLGLGLSALGLTPAFLDLSSLQGAGEADPEPGQYHCPALVRESTLAQGALAGRETSPNEGRRSPSTNPAASVSIQPIAGNRTSDLLADDSLALAAALHRPRFPAVSTAETSHAAFTAPAVLTQSPRPGTTGDGPASARSGSAEQLPPSLHPTARNGVAASRLAPNRTAFDPWTGQLAIRADGADHTIQENATAGGFLTITLNGQPHSSDPASSAFDPLLAGATAARLTGIRLDASGGPDTLILGTQQLAGGLSVSAPGATVVTQDISVGGPLVVQAADITVRGALQASDITLAATGWVNIEGTGRVVAGSSDTGGSIAVFADKFVNTGQLHADGPAGGQIAAQANNILNAGSITADGTAGAGGTVRIGFAGAYIDTAAALTSANGTGVGAGGHVIIDGGATGHLFSSGRQQAAGSVGGAVDLVGREIVLDGGAVNASGETGGGSISVGGDFQRRNPAVTSADTVTVTPATILQVNARRAGDGGRVVVWADTVNDFQGVVLARGGAAGGAGGAIEVSSHGKLTYGGSADAGAPSGRHGTLLLDPKNLIISAAPVAVFPKFDLIDPHPTTGGSFGAAISVLGNGNVAVTNPADNFGGSNAGAVYLFDGLRGTLISSLVGSNAGDRVGDAGQFGGPSIISVSNGNYVVVSPFWTGNRGAVTWGSGTAGVGGIVSEANSLVGTAPDDSVGGVTVLPNGNYVVSSPKWNGTRGAVTWASGATGVRGPISATISLVGSNPGDYVGFSLNTPSLYVLPSGNYVVITPQWNGHRGAVTWGDRATGVHGTVSAATSLVGNNAGDNVGYPGIVTLTNGNYVVGSPGWNGNRGAATWVSGTAGMVGTISETNSLVGSNANDFVGGGSVFTRGVLALPDGNYVVASPNWNGNRGAATWHNGASGSGGVVSEANSLVGADPDDNTGQYAVALSNGNYVVTSPGWNSRAGAVTWVRGMAGTTGVVSAANSLVGTHPMDQVGGLYGNSITVLPNGSYVVSSPSWNSRTGAVTWARGTAGVTGAVSEANSLVGSTPGDYVGTVTVLSNGNFVVSSIDWNNQRGELTWGSGTSGVSGMVSTANSIVGSDPGDWVGGGVTALSNGSYVFRSSSWNGNRGAVTWGSGTAGTTGVVSAANSLVGTNPGDAVGGFGIVALPNGNYVVPSIFWNNHRGAVTWGSGTSGVSGPVSEMNSLIGAQPDEQVGFTAGALSNGDYVVITATWAGGRGAVTWGNGTAGVTGLISEANSLVGNPGDRVGFDGIVPLSNGNLLVLTPDWNQGRGAVTWVNSNAAVRGLVSEANSLVGTTPFEHLNNVIPLPDGNYLVTSEHWNSDRGAVTWGSGTAGVTGPISDANSLVGSKPSDFVGSVRVLPNNNYVVTSPGWSSGRGAVTWGDGSRGVRGVVSGSNSLIGTNSTDRVGSAGIVALADSDLLVESPFWGGNRGALTWVNGATGQVLDGADTITGQNSLLGQAHNSPMWGVVDDPLYQGFLARSLTDTSGPISIGLTDPNQFTYARGQAQTVTLTPDFLTATLNTGTAVVLQASNDITVDDPITVSAGGHGGALTLQAGRSILLNASITTDNGPLTLIANDTVADGVVNSQRDPGNGSIVMAGGTTLDTGTAPLDIELRDGAGLTHSDSRAINLQTLVAGSVSVVNNGPDAGSDLRLGPVTTSGSQSYSSPHGVTNVTADLTSGDSPITFTDSVVINDGVSVNTGSGTVNLAGAGTQTMQTGAGVHFDNLNHTGTGTLQLTSSLTVAGTFLQTAGTFDANDQPVTVGGAAVLTGGKYLAGTAPQTFADGLVLTGGEFTSSSGPMVVQGGVTLTGGTLSGQGQVDRLTIYGGTVAPGTDAPGLLNVAGAVAFNPLTTFRVLLDGTHPGSGYSRLRASGTVKLGGSTLELVPGFEPPVGHPFKIVTTADRAGVEGTFAGLPESAVFSQDGYQFQITYRGGRNGTSVIVTRVA